MTEETHIESENAPVSPTLEQNQPHVPQNSFAIPTSQSELRFEQRKALIRDPERMWNWFESSEDEPFEIVDADMLMTGLPALPFAPRSIPKPRERKKDKKKGQEQAIAEEGLKKPISNNIKTLWEIKKSVSKTVEPVDG